MMINTEISMSYRKTVTVQIMGESVYEKDVLFYFTIGEPKLVKGRMQMFSLSRVIKNEEKVLSLKQFIEFLLFSLYT